MADEPKNMTACDGCVILMSKAHRVHKALRFCSTCYPRYFESRSCPKCQVMSRLLRSDSSDVCRRCQLRRPCIRCENTEYEIGKVTEYGPVCKSCAKYFVPRGRALGGVASKELTTSVPNDGCLQQKGTCSSCRRHRKRKGKLCLRCLEQGHVPCPICKELMPAGRGNACERCYWIATYSKRVQMNLAVISAPPVAEAFKNFSDWLKEQLPAQKAAITINRYFRFFLQIDTHWSEIPRYEDLLSQFSAEGLRRFRLPMKWFNECGAITVDAALREASSERRRIKSMLSEVGVASAPS